MIVLLFVSKSSLDRILSKWNLVWYQKNSSYYHQCLNYNAALNLSFQTFVKGDGLLEHFYSLLEHRSSIKKMHIFRPPITEIVFKFSKYSLRTILFIPVFYGVFNKNSTQSFESISRYTHFCTYLRTNLNAHILVHRTMFYIIILKLNYF